LPRSSSSDSASSLAEIVALCRAISDELFGVGPTDVPTRSDGRRADETAAAGNAHAATAAAEPAVQAMLAAVPPPSCSPTRRGLKRAGGAAESGPPAKLAALSHPAFQAYAARVALPPAPDHCDCGQPRKMIGGRHFCRFYGSFECQQCANRWTSAFTWKGEKQACRKCNFEMLPWKTEQLDGRLPLSDIRGAHDTMRCSLCRKLGYDCSLRV
jgi:hypothetical protein